jgi:DNA-binding NtrC family response regulator
MAHEGNRRILLIEDNSDYRETLVEVLKGQDYFVHPATDAAEALGLLQNRDRKFDIILSDINMPGLNGIDMVKHLREAGNETPVVLMTGFATVQMGVEAIKNGAQDFVTKPIEIEDLIKTLEKTMEYSNLIFSKPEEELQETRSTTLIAQSPSMKKIFALIDRIARVDSTVLILGESGTGKEVIAQEIHRRSKRKAGKFVAINCAAIPQELLESELFGHTRGSFTGAVTDKKGLFEEAEGGTLFLDEIGDMDPALQAKLLRVLQERKIRPVGSTVSKNLDVRIVAATHRDLRSAIVEGRFREDLFYRLSVIPVFIAPLRERKEDIKPLAIYFAKRASKAVNEGYKTFSDDAILRLESHPWTGNVRELENTVERSLVLCPRNVLTVNDLNFLDGEELPSLVNEAYSETQVSNDQENFCLKEIEKQTVISALKKTAGKKAEAALLLGIDRKTLHRKEQEYELNG